MTFVKSERQTMRSDLALYAGRLILVVGLLFTTTVQAQVVINEVQLAGQTSKDEFVELYNNSESAVDVAGWRLTKKTAAGNEANLATTFPSMSIPAHGFLLIAHPTDYKGSVPPDVTYSTSSTIADDNTIVLYRDSGDTVIDRVGFGKATDREGATIANPDPGQSVSRRDGADTNDNSRDFSVVVPSPTNRSGSIGSTPPPPQAPSQPTTTEQQQTTTTKTPAPEIVVNELYPNPTGADDDEFIELKNNGTNAVDVGLWEVGVSRGRRYVIPRGTIIGVQGFLLLERRITGLALENTGDVVSLYQPEEDRPFFTVRYRDDAPEGQSYARSDSGKRWQWTTTRTPNTANILTDPPLPPVLVFTWSPDDPDANEAITFDASDSFDPDREALTLSWDFGDGTTEIGTLVTHTYGAGGRYTVRLVGTTQTASTTIERTVIVRSLKTEPIAVATEKQKEVIEEGDAPDVKEEKKKGEGEPALRSLGEVGSEGWGEVSTRIVRTRSIKGAQTIRGTVLVVPGKFGKTRMVVRVGDRAITAQYTHAWPTIAEGAIVTLAGRMSPTVPDRFLVQTVVDIAEGEASDAEPQAITTTELKTIPSGTLVAVHGEITERHGSTLFLDDGVGEAKIQIKATTGVSATSFQEGTRASVTGIVLASTDGNIIAPRGIEDITIDTPALQRGASVPWAKTRQWHWWWYGGIVLAGAGLALGTRLVQRKRIRIAAQPPQQPSQDLIDPSSDEDG